jgi:hypothetical protein
MLVDNRLVWNTRSAGFCVLVKHTYKYKIFGSSSEVVSKSLHSINETLSNRFAGGFRLNKCAGDR